MCEIYDSIDGNASDYDIRRGSEKFQATATPKEPFARRFEQPLDSPATEPSTPARAKTPRLVRQIAQISAGRVDVPCPFENAGHDGGCVLRPKDPAGLLIGARTDPEHRSNHDGGRQEIVPALDRTVRAVIAELRAGLQHIPKGNVFIGYRIGLISGLGFAPCAPDYGTEGLSGSVVVARSHRASD